MTAYPMPANADPWQALEAMPHQEVIRLDHDETVKALMLRAGIAGKLSQRPGLNSCAITYARHPSHWIVFCFWYGHDRPEDNGYSAVCLAKSKYTQAQAEIGMGRFISIIMPNHTPIEYSPYDSPHN
jgi:hypothetical protein